MTQTFNQLLNQTEQLQPLLKRLPVILNLVLIITCAQLLSVIIWMFLTESDAGLLTTVSPVNSSSVSQQNNARETQQAFRNLTSAHLFGVSETKIAATVTKAAPETKLNLVLKGVLAAGSSEMASAIISPNANGKEEIYGINDKIPGGVTLREIHPEHVILERQGRLETLRMLKDKGSEQIFSSAKTQSSTSASISKKLKNIRTELISNPKSFRDYALPVVVRENGKQIGYRLQPKGNNELFAQAGIKPSDVITSINGKKLNNMQNSLGALKALRSANNVDIIVKRNGVEVPLSIKLQ